RSPSPLRGSSSTSATDSGPSKRACLRTSRCSRQGSRRAPTAGASLFSRRSQGYALHAMSENGQQPLPLIMMRELADNVATPLFLVDRNGVLVYYNEAAEVVLGLRYVEAGSLTAEQWSARWAAEDVDGHPLPADKRPLAVAMKERRPSHRPMILLD